MRAVFKGKGKSPFNPMPLKGYKWFTTLLKKLKHNT